MDITINILALKQFKLSQDNDELLTLDSINSQLTIIDNTLNLNQLNVTQGNNELTTNAVIDLSAKSDGVVSLNNQVHWSLNDQLISTQGSVDGTWESINLNLNTTHPFSSDLSLNISNILTSEVAWHGSIETHAKSVVTADKQEFDLGQGQFETSGQFSPNAGLASLAIKLSGDIHGDINLNKDNSNSHANTARTQPLTQWKINTDLELSKNTLSVHKLSFTEQNDTPELSKEVGRLELSLSLIHI